MKDVLKIYSYKDAARKRQLGSFKCLVSPTAIRFKQQNTYSDLHPVNSSIPLSAFASGGKSSMEISLILDGTGAYAEKNEEPVGVIDQLISLMSNSTEYNGSIHQPPFLKVVWGQIPVFLCRAESMDVNYKTFNNEGIPVQANVDLVLIEDVDQKLSKRQANKQSPDLYHYHLVLDSESLPGISYQYYGDPGYIGLIAQTNSLDNLYQLKPDTMLLIPPLGLNPTS